MINLFAGKEENECHWHMRQEVVRTATAQMRSTEDMRGRGHVDGNILLLTKGLLYHPINFPGRGWNIQDLQMYFLCKLGEFAQPCWPEGKTAYSHQELFPKTLCRWDFLSQGGGAFRRGMMWNCAEVEFTMGFGGLDATTFVARLWWCKFGGHSWGWGCWWVILPGYSRVQPLRDSATKWAIHFSWCLVFFRMIR